MQSHTNGPKADFAALIGLDWADQKHDVWIHDVRSEERTYCQIENTPEALEDWLGKLRRDYPCDQIAICLEQSRGMLIYKLMAYGFVTLFPINPAMSAKYREAFAPSHAKGDCTDAELMMELLICHRDRLRPWRPDDAQTRKLTRFCEERRNAVNLRTKLAAQIGAKLKSYFPQAKQFAGEDITTNMACDFLVKWPTLQQFKRARPNTIRGFYYKHNCRSKAKVEERIQLRCSATPATDDQAIIEPLSEVIKMIAKLIRRLNESIRLFNKSIKRVLAAHSDAAIFCSLPGAGPALAPRLLTAFGSDRSRFSSASEVQTLYGIAPVTEQSGKQRWVHRRWRCPKFQLQSFHEFAGQSILFSAWAKAYYQKQRQGGQKHHAAVRSLAYKWIRVIYACWKNRTPYDEERYIQTLKRRNSPLTQYLESNEKQNRVNA